MKGSDVPVIVPFVAVNLMFGDGVSRDIDTTTFPRVNAGVVYIAPPLTFPLLADISTLHVPPPYFPQVSVSSHALIIYPFESFAYIVTSKELFIV